MPVGLPRTSLDTKFFSHSNLLPDPGRVDGLCRFTLKNFVELVISSRRRTREGREGRGDGVNLA